MKLLSDIQVFKTAMADFFRRSDGTSVVFDDDERLDGGSISAKNEARSVIVNDTNQVAINVIGFDPGKDMLMVYVNSVFQQAHQDYALNHATKTIVKNQGVWPVGTVIDFVAFQTIKSPESERTVIKTESFAVGANQTVFTLTNGYYLPDNDRINIFIGGLRQPKTAFVEISTNSFSLNALLPEGTKIESEWFEFVSTTSVDISAIASLKGQPGGYASLDGTGALTSAQIPVHNNAHHSTAYEAAENKAVPNGYASLDGMGFVPQSQLPPIEGMVNHGDEWHDVLYERTANKAALNGYASLDATGNVPVNQLSNVKSMEEHGDEWHNGHLVQKDTEGRVIIDKLRIGQFEIVYNEATETLDFNFI